MKRLVFLCTALAAMLYFVQSLEQQQATVTLDASEVFAVDGDTLDHGEDRYRLVGFDAPETFRAQCDAENALGLKAKARLTEIIRTAGQVELLIEPERDRYGRFLAVARAADRDVGPVLISEDLARPYNGGKRQSWCN